MPYAFSMKAGFGFTRDLITKGLRLEKPSNVEGRSSNVENLKVSENNHLAKEVSVYSRNFLYSIFCRVFNVSSVFILFLHHPHFSS